MKKYKVFCYLLLGFLTLVIFGCKKDIDDNSGNEPDNPENIVEYTPDGLYLGIIGFNNQIQEHPMEKLTETNRDVFLSFVDNLHINDGTALLHAVNTAIDYLANDPVPENLKNVTLVTFTDGLDNASLIHNPNFNTQSEFLTHVNSRIINEQIDGNVISAFAIGLKGDDVVDESAFHENLEKLSSSSSNVFEVNDMYEAAARFVEIASQISGGHSVTDVSFKIPGGYDNNTLIRITFDYVQDASLSDYYIEGSFRREGDVAVLENLQYNNVACQNGFSVTSNKQIGASYWFTFNDIKDNNGNPINSVNGCRLWINSMLSSWQPESEFNPTSSTEIIGEQGSAKIMLVLDCSSSLGYDFVDLKSAAKQFIKTICAFNSGGGNGETIIAPEGAVKGLFTINSKGDQVFFSKGNLQYVGDADPMYWCFAEQQWDIIGKEQEGSSSDIKRDLFGWATSGYRHGGICFQPWSVSVDNNDYHAYGSLYYNLYDLEGVADWGYNPILNGGNQINKWRTLTKAEWDYVLSRNLKNSTISSFKACLNGINGIVVLPDDWNSDLYNIQGELSTSFELNSISVNVWNSIFAPLGCVFLPAAGSRYGENVYDENSIGYYWTSERESCNCEPTLYEFNDHMSGILTPISGQLYGACKGLSVRLVQDYQKCNN